MRSNKRFILVSISFFLFIFGLNSCQKVDDFHEHSFSEDWTSDDYYHWHTATCEHSSEIKNKEPHIWNSGELKTPATCTEKGVRIYTCTVCNAHKTEIIPERGHQFDNGKITKVPTCKEKGIKTYTCTICGIIKTDEIPMVNHEYDEGIITKKPSVTENGEKIFTCKKCGQTKTESIETVHVTDIQLNKKDLYLLPEDTFELNAIISPDNADFKNVKWASSNSSIVEVNQNGELLAKEEGTVTITATTEDKGLVSSCNVKVCPIEEQIEITSSCSNVILNGYAYGCGVPTLFINNSIHEVIIDMVEVYDGDSLILFTADQNLLGVCLPGESKGVQKTQSYNHIMGTTFKINWYFNYGDNTYLVTREIIH